MVFDTIKSTSKYTLLVGDEFLISSALLDTHQETENARACLKNGCLKSLRNAILVSQGQMHIVLESTITEIVFICKGNWIIKCHTRRPKFDWPSSKNNCKSSPDEFCPESDSALTHNLHFVKTRRPHFLVVPEEMWLEENEGAADGNPNFPMEIIGGGLPVSQNLSIYGFPKVGRAGMYRESLASPVTLQMKLKIFYSFPYLCRRGKYGFTIGNELQDSRSGWFSYSSDVQIIVSNIFKFTLLSNSSTLFQIPPSKWSLDICGACCDDR
ncbi:hypothetical protein Prudu_012628 [Prunus dulcis]|uniref:Uncharacterized protein n=1 Tax=Prunus dulcis TaxID=3755 RepID=A0A4Y1RDR5_PRUDU|nr:hypothetical protein Prudu_012628 [Prunus dulcis]